MPENQQVQQIIDRWKLRVEKMDEANYFLYGEVGPKNRILFLIWSRAMCVSGANDYIDLYLKDNDPELAARLMDDIAILIQDLDDLRPYRFYK